MKVLPNSRTLERTVRAFARGRPGLPIFLVGGAVRDRLSGRQSVDFDFSLPRDEAELAGELERRGFGRAVRISSPTSPFPVWRLTGPRITVDVARFENADSIERDLARRDFTVNAMALDVVSGRLVDPWRGTADLARGRIRMISARNLDADPIRVLRAYRIAATRGWRIDGATRAALRRRTRKLSSEAKERVRGEILRLMSAPRASRAIGWAARDGVLASCLGLRRSPPAARVMAPFDRPRLTGAERFLFRMAVLFFRSGVESDRVADRLAEQGFSRLERSTIARAVRFLEEAFSDRPPAQVLFSFRNEWNSFRRLLRLSAAARTETARARALLRESRRCRFEPAPVDGRDIAGWLALAPGKELGRALERARFLYFHGEAKTRRQLETSVRAFDAAGGVG